MLSGAPFLDFVQTNEANSCQTSNYRALAEQLAHVTSSLVLMTSSNKQTDDLLESCSSLTVVHVKG